MFTRQFTSTASNRKHISCLYVPCRTKFACCTNIRKYVSTGIHGQLEYLASQWILRCAWLCFCTSLFLFALLLHTREAPTTILTARHCNNAITLSRSVFIVHADPHFVEAAREATEYGSHEQCAATTVSEPVKHTGNQGSFKSDWFTAFIAL